MTGFYKLSKIRARICCTNLLSILSSWCIWTTV